MGKNDQFIKVSLSLVSNIGTDAAILHAILLNASQVWKKDDDGYFCIFTKYLMRQTGWYQGKIIRERNKLIEVGLLRFKQGVNQNTKNKYKIVGG